MVHLLRSMRQVETGNTRYKSSIYVPQYCLSLRCAVLAFGPCVSRCFLFPPAVIMPFLAPFLRVVPSVQMLHPFRLSTHALFQQPFRSPCVFVLRAISLLRFRLLLVLILLVWTVVLCFCTQYNGSVLALPVKCASYISTEVVPTSMEEGPTSMQVKHPCEF